MSLYLPAITDLSLYALLTPTSVKITGAEGRQIKIQHGSPAVLLRKVIDKQTNSIVSVTWNATNSVSHLLDMQHTVDANQ